MVALAQSRFDLWAAREGYNTAPAVVPTNIRTYADRDTQAVFVAYKAGAADTARMVTESTL
jgi:hypothetical protein